MIIEANKVVSVNYTLSSKKAGQKEEAQVEKTSIDNPFVFLFGVGGLIEGFENNLKGKKVGDKFDFHIAPADGYGEIVIENIVNIPINAFHDDKGKVDHETVKVGNMLPMTDNQGNRMNGIVHEITGEHVRMDFNHPLAGQELHFVGEVLAIRDATTEELEHGHVHGVGGHHH
jgi:FKBP-type peptidyl-prolyl cis-trans isomerase SlyD